MSIEKRGKLNHLLLQWLRGTVYTTKYLVQEGYSNSLLEKYYRSEIVDLIGKGAYKLYNDKIEWYGGINALQKQYDNSIRIGGKTALQLSGYAHYISENIEVVSIFGKSGDKIPKWFELNDWGVKLEYYINNLFDSLNITISQKIENIEIKVSAPEQAILEMLYLIPEHESFEEGFLIMENLISLRSDVMQSLLEGCNSIKVNRLFFYMAEKHNLPFLNLIDREKINFGSGKREIIKGGLFDKKYLITVPADLGQNNESNVF